MSTHGICNRIYHTGLMEKQSQSAKSLKIQTAHPDSGSATIPVHRGAVCRR